MCCGFLRVLAIKSELELVCAVNQGDLKKVPLQKRVVKQELTEL